MSASINTFGALLVPAESREEFSLGASYRGGRRRSGHAVTSATKADCATSHKEEQERDKCQPEAWASGSLTSETEVAHLILEVYVEGDVDRKRDESEDSREERYEGCNKGESDVLREREQQRNEGDSARNGMNSQTTRPRGTNVD